MEHYNSSKILLISSSMFFLLPQDVSSMHLPGVHIDQEEERDKTPELCSSGNDFSQNSSVYTLVRKISVKR